MVLLLASKAGLGLYLLSHLSSRDLEKQCKGPGGEKEGRITASQLPGVRHDVHKGGRVLESRLAPSSLDLQDRVTM